MSYALTYKPSVERELMRLPREILGRADAAIQKLGQVPRPPGCIKLAGVDAYRVRVGDYRIIYSIDDASRVVVIQAVRHRREVYRGL